jgi:Oxidoreductase family, NAD-binding Rossmann fold
MLRLGIIGMSEGNGHPYSWSAIFNGYNQEYAQDCPFPVILAYLSKQQFPEDQISNARVTCVWTQDIEQSRAIALFSSIDHVCQSLEEMTELADAVLLARDDAETHFEYAIPFLKAGIPIFIDKPFAYTVQEAQLMLDNCQQEWQLFTCSSLRFAKEFQLAEELKLQIQHIEASVVKRWNKYGIHILEPSVQLLPHRGKLLSVSNIGDEFSDDVFVKWENATARFRCTGDQPSPLEINYEGSQQSGKLTFSDTYNCFKASLLCFVDNVVIGKSLPIARTETLEIITILEKGLKG